MTRRTSIAFLTSVAVIPLSALAFAGGTNAASRGPTHPTLVLVPSSRPASATPSSSPPTVEVRRTRFGQILVDSRGRSLYLFKKDTGGKSRCSGSCAVNWPPLLATGRPVAGSGTQASKLGTTRRSDGKTQVVYNGHPLYRFIGDSSPGTANGEGLTAFGARWFVVSPAGTQIS